MMKERHELYNDFTTNEMNNACVKLKQGNGALCCDVGAVFAAFPLFSWPNNNNNNPRGRLSLTRLTLPGRGHAAKNKTLMHLYIFIILATVPHHEG